MQKTTLFILGILVYSSFALAQSVQKVQKKVSHHSNQLSKWDTTNKNVVASEDGNLRIYWWDTNLGGTMAKYKAFVKYNAGAVVKMKMLSGEGEKDYGCSYEAVYTIKRKDNKVIYLVLTTATTGVDDLPETIQAYTIENGELEDTMKVFKTPKKSYNKIDIDYDWRSAYQKEKIHLSKDKKKVYIPVLNNLEYTGNFLVYVFDGNNFVFDKNAK